MTTATKRLTAEEAIKKKKKQRMTKNAHENMERCA